MAALCLVCAACSGGTITVESWKGGPFGETEASTSPEGGALEDAPAASDRSIALEDAWDAAADAAPTRCGGELCGPYETCCMVADPSGACTPACTRFSQEQGGLCPNPTNCAEPTAAEAACDPERCGPLPGLDAGAPLASDQVVACDDGSFSGLLCMADAHGDCFWGYRSCPPVVSCTSQADCAADQICTGIAPPCLQGAVCKPSFQCKLAWEPPDGGDGGVQMCVTADDCQGPLARVCGACTVGGRAVIACSKWRCAHGVCLPGLCE